MNNLRLIFLLALSLTLFGCEKNVESTEQKSKERESITLDISEIGVFTLESSEDEERINFGFVKDGLISFNGYCGKNNSTLYHTFRIEENGNQVVVADVDVNGIPDFWLLLDKGGKLIKKIPVEFEMPPIFN